MNAPVKQGLSSLTDKEKETLRLVVRGHDAKSVARSLGLSVHTINERLRDSRRKLAVSSSREAARMLLAAETPEVVPPPPESHADSGLGEDDAPDPADRETAPVHGAGRGHSRFPMIAGGFVMTLALGLLMFVASPHVATAPPPPAADAVAAPDAAVVDTGRRWLALLDQSNWEESYRATGAAFRRLNTLAAWTAASEEARAPLGAMLSRTFVSQQNLPAPPAGYEVLKFRSRFANRGEAVETVTLDREDGGWRVVGVTIG